ncbi:MAG: hypothetical protein J0647_06250 [Campylobacteraceae bacterium]|nr:hypothetical protein [Campylobacteraceae bacterium]
MLTFYEISETFNDDLITVAYLIAYFGNDKSIKRIMGNLEISKVKPYSVELEKILDLKMNTIKDLMRVHNER